MRSGKGPQSSEAWFARFGYRRAGLCLLGLTCDALDALASMKHRAEHSFGLWHKDNTRNSEHISVTCISFEKGRFVQLGERAQFVPSSAHRQRTGSAPASILLSHATCTPSLLLILTFVSACLEYALRFAGSQLFVTKIILGRVLLYCVPDCGPLPPSGRKRVSLQRNPA